MAHERRKKFSGSREIIAELGAAERMVKTIQSVYRRILRSFLVAVCSVRILRAVQSADQLLILVYKLFHDAVHAADERNDPDFVADSRTAVGSAVSVECFRGLFFVCIRRQIINLMVVNKVCSTVQSGVGIVRMNPAALFDRSAGNRNDCAVLDDGSALYDIGQGNLMALRDLFERGDLDLSEITGSQGDGLSLCYSIQRNGNIVARVNLNKLHKRFLCQSSLLATAAA